MHLLLSGVPPIVPELKGDADTSYFDDIEQDDHGPTETFPTPTVSLFICVCVCVCVRVRVLVRVWSSVAANEANSGKRTSCFLSIHVNIF